MFAWFYYFFVIQERQLRYLIISDAVWKKIMIDKCVTVWIYINFNSFESLSTKYSTIFIVLISRPMKEKTYQT